MGQVILTKIEGVCEVGFTPCETFHFQGRNLLTEKKKGGRIKREAEEKRLEVDSAILGNTSKEIPYTISDHFEVLKSIRQELWA
jgi:hypothetical protein